MSLLQTKFFKTLIFSQIEEAQQQMDENELKENGEEEDADQPGPSNRF
jgi:hypothetical protein